jgi:hypothetical protein
MLVVMWKAAASGILPNTFDSTLLTFDSTAQTWDAG